MITDYTSLQSQVADWLNREDLGGVIPTFIQVAEGKLLRDPRVRNMADGSATIERLSVENTSNWLLDEHPDIYLYAALVESAPYLKDDPRVAVWEEQLERRLAELGTARLDPGRTLSLANKGDLERVIADWLDRPDLTAVVPQFVRLAEAALSTDFRVRRIVELEEFTITEDGDSAPAGLQSVEGWFHDSDSYKHQMEVATAGRLGPLRAQFGGESGVPRYAAITGGKFFYAPSPDGEYSTLLTYWQGLTPLAAPGSSNWILDNHPDVYLFGSLMKAAPYLRNDERTELWAVEFEAALDRLNIDTDRQLFGGHAVRPIRQPIG